MPILVGDVKLVASQVMDDVAEGGGAPTSSVIVDGTSNSLFNDISEMDRAGGRVNLRKVFASVQTDTTDTYLGGNVIVAEAPSDPRVAVTIFATEEVFDRRTNARDRIEAYLNKGSLWNGYLLENHITGQRSIQLFQRVGAELPAIGKTLYLVANEGLANEFSQYIRITRVASETRTFSYGSGSGIVDYEAVVVTCDLSDALRFDFPGSPPDRLFTMAAGKTKTRDTVVADAAKYCGVVKTTQPIAIGDVAASVSSIFTQLVPSAQTETPLLDLTAGGTSEALVESANGTVSYTTSVGFNASTILSVGNAIQPGTLSISVSGATLTDNGGQLMAGATVIGTVNYARGQIAMATSAPNYGGTKTITFRPAAAPIRVADTAGVRVDIEIPRATALCALARNSPPQRRSCALAAALSRRIEMRMGGQPVEGLFDVAAIAAGTECDQRQQPSVMRGLEPADRRQETAHLRQGVVVDVAEAVAVADQGLGGVEPAGVVASPTWANSAVRRGITWRVKKSALTSMTVDASSTASSASRSSTHSRGLPTAIAMADNRSPPRSPITAHQSMPSPVICCMTGVIARRKPGNWPTFSGFTVRVSPATVRDTPWGMSFSSSLMVVLTAARSGRTGPAARRRALSYRRAASLPARTCCTRPR